MAHCAWWGACEEFGWAWYDGKIMAIKGTSNYTTQILQGLHGIWMLDPSDPNALGYMNSSITSVGRLLIFFKIIIG
jgi:hypothetical protein